MAGQPIRPNPAPLEIYFLPGVDPGNRNNIPVYQKIFDGTIGPGEGRNNATILPELANPVVIPAGSSYSFYITFTNSTLGTMYLKSVSSVGSVAASDEYVDVLDGYGMLYPFSLYSPGWRWNGEAHIIKINCVEWNLRAHVNRISILCAGNVYYSVEAETSPPSTSNPTVMPPTLNPTTSQPTTSKPSTSTPTSLVSLATPAPTTSQPTSPPPTGIPTTSKPNSIAPTTFQPTSRAPASVPTTSMPTSVPSTAKPTSAKPTSAKPTVAPIFSPPTTQPTSSPSATPTASPSVAPTGAPTAAPTSSPSASPTGSPITSEVNMEFLFYCSERIIVFVRKSNA